MRNHIWKTWARALGEKASHQKHEADAVAVIRSFIFLSYLTTNVFIVAGVIRHWNDGREPRVLQEIPVRITIGFDQASFEGPGADPSHGSSGALAGVQNLRQFQRDDLR